MALPFRGKEMGLIYCKKHGESGFTQRISESVVKFLHEDTPLSDDNLRTVTIDMYDDGDFLGSDVYLITREEFRRSSLSETNQAHSEDEYDDPTSKLPKMSGVCFDCLQEYKEKHHVTLRDFH